MENMTTNRRNSGIEILRIVSMLVIIAHHYVVNSGVYEYIIGQSVLSYRDYVILIFGWGGKTAINCFLLITGYYMCEAQISLKKWLKLLGEVEFYSIVVYIVFVIFGYEEISLGRVFEVVFPFRNVTNGFTSCYLLFYAFIPFLNKLLAHIDQREHILLMSLCLLIHTILPALTVITAITFNYIVWFGIVYIVAAYIRKYPVKWYSDTVRMGVLLLGSLLLSWGSVVGLSMIGRMMGRTNGYYCYFWVSDSNQILAVVTAVCAFLFFRSIPVFYNDMINKIAASTFGVLMIHANSDAMRKWLWKDTLNNVSACELPFPYWMLHAVGSVLLVYIVCTLLDWLRLWGISFIHRLFRKEERTT